MVRKVSAAVLFALWALPACQSADINLSPLATSPEVVVKQIHDHLASQFGGYDKRHANYKLTWRLPDVPGVKPTPPEVFDIWRDESHLVVQSHGRVYVSTPFRAFSLHRAPKADGYAIGRITPLSPNPRSLEQIAEFRQSAEIGIAAEAIDLFSPSIPTWYSVLALSPEVRCVKGVLQKDGRIRFDFASVGQASDKNTKIVGGNILFDPANDYRPVEAETQIEIKTKAYSGTAVYISKFEYQDSNLTFPGALKSYTTQQKWTGSLKKNNRTDVFEYTECTDVPVPPDRLTLEYYGVTDPIRDTSWPVWSFVLIGVGLVGVAVYVWMRRRHRRQAAKTP